MARRPRFTREQLIETATVLAVDGGPAAVTMQGLAETSGAASGSLYHRFESRSELLAEVFIAALEAFQGYWWPRASAEEDPGTIAALTVRWARTHRSSARVLLTYRTEELLKQDMPDRLRRRAAQLRRTSGAHLAELSSRLLGSSSREAIERTTFALAQVPLAALREPLTRNRPITGRVEGMVYEAATALMVRRQGDDR